MGTLLRGPGPDGPQLDVPIEQLDSYLARGWTPVTVEERATDIRQQAMDARADERGLGGKIAVGLTEFGSGVSGGLTDLGLRAVLPKDEWEQLKLERARNSTLGTVANIAGAVVPALVTGGATAPTSAAGRLAAATPAGRASIIGAEIANEVAATGGAARKVLGGLAGGAAEGFLQGAGSGVRELALSDDPITIERATSVIGSNALFGGATGGLAGGATKGIELGLSKARTAIQRGANATAAAESLPADLAALDAKGLAAAHVEEVAAIKTARGTERQAIAEELGAIRRATEDAKPWLSVKGLTDEAVGKAAGSEIPVQELAAMTKKADTRIRTLLNNPAAIADNVAPAKVALQAQEHAYEQILAREPAIRAAIAADTSGARAAALDAIPAALERNRTLQARIADISGDVTSPRLQQIATAKEVLAEGRARPQSMGEQMLTGIAFGKAAAAVGGVAAAVGTDNPIGAGLAMLAPVAGAKVSKYVAEKVFGRVAKASAEQSARVTKAVEAFATVGRAAQRAAPVLATKVLSSLRYAPEKPAEKREKAADEPKSGQSTELAKAYNARSAEIRSQMTTGPTGALVMRPEARARVAANLMPVAAIAPYLADKLETQAVRGLEFLANVMPKRPSVGGMQLGPDLWQPSDMQMRQFARYAAAVEDPHAIVERLTDGSVTPEDAEVMRAVYPEMYEDIKRQIVEKQATLQKQLPYQRRVALSIFSGVPVDPSMDPRVIAALQSNFPVEDGTEGGTQAPRPQPQFGSVRSAEKPTASQAREAGAIT